MQGKKGASFFLKQLRTNHPCIQLFIVAFITTYKFVLKKKKKQVKSNQCVFTTIESIARVLVASSKVLHFIFMPFQLS
jgi:hypothetical protein